MSKGTTRWGLGALLAFLGASAVFGAEVPPEVGVIALSTRHGFGHACPIGPQLALTAGHVLDVRPFDPSFPLQPGRWNGGAAEGTYVPLNVFKDRDLGLIAPFEGTPPFPHWYQVASKAPAEGDRLRIVGFEWGKKGKFLAPKVWEVKVLRLVGGILVISDNPDSGSSGSCALNEAGEVVGVNVWGFDLKGSGIQAGGVVKVVGEEFQVEEKE